MGSAYGEATETRTFRVVSARRDAPDACDRLSLYGLVRKLTSLLRWLDLRLWSNRFVAIATVLGAGCMFGYALLSGYALAKAAFLAAQTGGGLFLAWAIARELDPDDSRSATLATFLAALLLAFETPDLSASLALMLAPRILLRSTGRTPTIPDAIFVVGLGFVCSSATAGLLAAAALAVALVADTRLPDPAPDRQGVVGLLVAAAAAGGAAYFETLGRPWQIPGGAELAGLLAVAASLLLLKVPPPRSANDVKQPLRRVRLVAATFVAVAAGILTVALVGGPALGKLSPLWAALVGVALHRRLRKAKVPED